MRADISRLFCKSRIPREKLESTNLQTPNSDCVCACYLIVEPNLEFMKTISFAFSENICDLIWDMNKFSSWGLLPWALSRNPRRSISELFHDKMQTLVSPSTCSKLLRCSCFPNLISPQTWPPCSIHRFENLFVVIGRWPIKAGCLNYVFLGKKPHSTLLLKISK